MAEEQAPAHNDSASAAQRNTETPSYARQAPNAAPKRRRGLRALLLFCGPFIVLIIASYAYINSGRYVTTENAYVKADKIAISADVDGRVVRIYVNENQAVESGQVLFEIDDRPFQIALARAQAELGIVANQIASYRTAYRQELAELEIAKDNLDFAQREYTRQQKLSKGGIVSKSRYDEARHGLQVARQKIAALQEDITHALANLGGDPAMELENHPRYQQVVAERDQAILDLEHTTVRAPAAGVISNIQLQPGEYVDAGKPVFSLIAADKLWITANLKETELTHVREGQQVTVSADTYPDYEWLAVVESISPATGAEFSLLPPQNATGNWVKVVQRIPVRLRLENPYQGPVLRTGMSVAVAIDTQFERPLPGIVQNALAWIKEKDRDATRGTAFTIANNPDGLAE